MNSPAAVPRARAPRLKTWSCRDLSDSIVARFGSDMLLTHIVLRVPTFTLFLDLQIPPTIVSVHWTG